MGIEHLLAAARERLVRPGPTEAYARVRAGALLVDTRPKWRRREFGEIPGALVIERNHLEWRLDPTSGASLPEADLDLDVIVLCQEGYSSSLAAAALLDVGLRRATDLDGGFRAWQEAGLPTVAGGTKPEQRSPGLLV